MRSRWFVLFALLFALVVGVFALFNGAEDDPRTWDSLRKVDDQPLYVMTYYGDYGFSDFLKLGIRPGFRSMADREALGSWACTCFSSMNADGELLFGRNFDWYDHPAMLLFTDPPGGYASVSMVDISYLGFADDEPSRYNRRDLLDAPYWPFDGMNERGLVVGMMAVPHAEGGEDPDKATIGSLHVIRLLLDHAGDVEAAIDLLQDYNVDFGNGPAVHYLIADPSGDSAVIEYLSGEPRVLRGEGGWQVSTNFLILEEMQEGANSGCRRYNTAYEALEASSGDISWQDAMSLLEGVSSSSSEHPTIWSAVYNGSTGEIRLVAGGNYARVHTFNLDVNPK